MTEHTSTAQSTPSSVELFFDPACPWAWMTSRWLMEAAQVRDLDVTWSVMSLAVLNEGRDLSGDYASMLEKAWIPVRTIMAATDGLGDEEANTLRKKMYDAYGQRIHVDGRGTEDMAAITAEVIEEVGLDSSLIEAGASADHDDAVRASHKRGIDMVGDEVGTPVISVEGTAFFGPVITPAPKGEAAGRLWDGCLLVASTPGFYEIKRTRTKGPDFS